MGDYYNMNNLTVKAYEYYVKILRSGFEQDIDYNDPVTHKKMMKVRSVVIKASR